MNFGIGWGAIQGVHHSVLVGVDWRGRPRILGIADGAVAAVKRTVAAIKLAVDVRSAAIRLAAIRLAAIRPAAIHLAAIRRAAIRCAAIPRANDVAGGKQDV